MVLHLVGFGLFGYESLTIHGIETLNMCSKIFLPKSSVSFLNDFQNKEFDVELCDATDLTTKESRLLGLACKDDVAVLLEGDFTHRNYYFTLRKLTKILNFKIEIVHNSALFNAVGCSGLQLYRFGKSFQIADYLSDALTLFRKINMNQKKKLHTLIYYGSVSNVNNSTTNKLFSSLMECITTQASELIENDAITKQTLCVAYYLHKGVVSSKFYSFSELTQDYGNQIFAIAICSHLHPVEEEALRKLCHLWNTREPNCAHTFHLIGLGLGSPKDITVAGKAALDGSKNVFLEAYTSQMIGGESALEKFHEKPIQPADREATEERSDHIISLLKDGDVSFLVVGDPLGATTHADLLIRVINANYNVNIVNNASIINAVCVCGLEPDSFGEIVSIPFWEESWQPDSFAEKIVSNMEAGWHTLCLLDIKVKEISWHNLARGKNTYDPARFMSVRQAATQLIQIIERGGGKTFLKKDTNVIGLARIGTKLEQIVRCSLQDMADTDLGDPLHSLIICTCKTIEVSNTQ